MTKQILLMDIGNTSAHFALYQGRRLKKESRLATPDISKKIISHVKKNYGLFKERPFVMASVVPDMAFIVRQSLAKSGIRVRQIGKEIPVPIVNRYKNPKQVGVDRLLNAYAGFTKYKRELILIDFGTAITFDVVSKKGEYLGGVIAPGIEISLDALFKRTALLPKTRLTHPKSSIGRDTEESIRVGCSIGIGGLCDRVVETIQKDRGLKALVVATGGYAQFMKKYCRVQKLEPYLVFEGMLESYHKKTS